MGGRLGRLLGVGLGLLGLAALLVALAPPLAFDSLTDHLVLPASYLQQGRVGYLAWTPFSGMPQNVEMLYTWAMALGGNEAAAMLGVDFGLLAAIGLLGYLGERLDGRAAWVAAAALLAGFTPVILLSSAYDDWLIFLFGLAALVCLDDWRQGGRRRPLLLAGLFVGLAFGCKYTSGVLAIAGLAALAWHAWKRRSAFVLPAVYFGLAGLLAALPWLIKNWLTTGSPIFPFLLPAGLEGRSAMAIYAQVGAWGNWMDVALIPLRATLVGFEQADGYMASIGPLLLALGGLGWLGWKTWAAGQRAAFQNAVIFSLTGLVVWAIGNQLDGLLIQTRYYFAIFPAFALLAGYGDWGLRQLNLPRLRPGFIAGALVLMALGLNLVESGTRSLQQGAPQAALGLKPQPAYLADALGWFQPAMQAVSELPAGSRALLLYEPRSLYCLPGCTGDPIMDRWKQARARLSEPQAILQDWRSQGYTHLLFYKKGLDFLVEANDPNHPPEDRATLQALLATLPQPVSFGGVYELYTISN